jgi:hypothetical protein
VHWNIATYNFIHYEKNKYNPISLSGQNAYEMRMTKDFYESSIVNEFAHFIAEKIGHRKIENTLSEYIAYVVQLSQMPCDNQINLSPPIQAVANLFFL